jgi:hypothetical protein
VRTLLGLSVALGLVLAHGGYAQDQPELNTVIDKAIKAMGGEEKVAKLRTMSWKGKAEFRSGDNTFNLMHEGSVHALDKYRVDAEVQAGGQSRKLLMVLSGDKCWEKENDAGTREIPKEQQAFRKDSLFAVRACQLLPSLRGKAFKLTPLGEVKIGDRQAVGMVIAHKDHTDLNVFFDKENGLPLKSEARLSMPGGQEITVEYHFSDYKEFEAIKHFSKITIKVDGKEYVTELTEITVQDKLEDGLFGRP